MRCAGGVGADALTLHSCVWTYIVVLLARNAPFHARRTVPPPRRRGPAAAAGALRGRGADGRGAGDVAGGEPAAGDPQEPGAARVGAAARPARRHPHAAAGRADGRPGGGRRAGGRSGRLPGRWQPGPHPHPAGPAGGDLPAVLRGDAAGARGQPADVGTDASAPAWVPFLPMLVPLLPRRALAVDIGAGEGNLLPLLSPLFERVVAIDRSAARLARCAQRVAALGLPNVRLREGTAEDAPLVEEVTRGGGADLVVLARVLHHAARPQDLVVAAARLLRPGGFAAVVDHVPHDDERLREQGHVWLGFEPARLGEFLQRAGLTLVFAAPLTSLEKPALHLAVGQTKETDH